jgi:rare lipoprotein A
MAAFGPAGTACAQDESMRIAVFGRYGMALPFDGAFRMTALLITLTLTACSNSNERRASPWQPPTVDRAEPSRAAVQPDVSRPGSIAAVNAAPGTVPKVKGVYKVGKPYVINGVTYYPAEDPSYDRTGIASWYGKDFHGKQTANGELFDMGAISAAHPTLPMPSLVYVTNLANGRTLLVRVNDRGPYKPGRIIDLSRRSASLLGFEGNGVTQIRVRYAGPAPLDPNDTSRERNFLASQSWNRYAGTGRTWFGLGMGGGTR